MRSEKTIVIGMSVKANQWIKKYCKLKDFYTPIYVNSNTPVIDVSTKLPIYYLRKYLLKTGGYVVEYIQSKQYAIDYFVFTALRYESNNLIIQESLWEEEQFYYYF